MRAGLRNGFSWAAAVGRFWAGGVLVVSGYLKAVRPPEEFAAVLAEYWVLPASFVIPVARAVPWAELVVGVCLFVGFGTRWAARAAAGLYGAFVLFLAQALWRGLPLADCGCFGGLGPHLKPSQSLTMDLILLAVCVGVAWDRENRLSVDRWILRPF